MSVQVFRAPFKYSREFAFIFDADGNMVMYMSLSSLSKIETMGLPNKEAEFEMLHRTAESLCETMNQHWKGGA